MGGAPGLQEGGHIKHVFDLFEPDGLHGLRVHVERVHLHGNQRALLDPWRQRHMHGMRLHLGLLGHGGGVLVLRDASDMQRAKRLRVERLPVDVT